ncbi:DUF2252 family protein [Thalassotalea euphylliae]|uniref:DUF2252 family protein n=1 Tax=Thalassotalea euphylliae TaxID=1655234 RepID=UPI003645721C
MVNADSRKSFIKTHLTSVDGNQPSKTMPKHVKMASSPFLFYRGSAPLFYHDIKNNLLSLPCEYQAVPRTTVIGDCHTSNFGFLTEEGSHGDKVIFSPNDFDDACVGYAVWDLARYITSLFLCVTHAQGVVDGTIVSEKDYSGKPSINNEHAIHAAHTFMTAYQETCTQCHTNFEARYQALSSFEENSILFKPYQKALSRGTNGDLFLEKSALAKAIDTKVLPIKFANNTEKFARLADNQYREIFNQFRPYVDDHIHDIVARLNAGTGSVNMARYYLLVGPEELDLSCLHLCHIVEVKKQRQAAPLAVFNNLSPVNTLNPAHLTVNCQRRMQRSPDLVLDEVIWQDQHWLVRSRHHAKVGIKPEQISIGKKVLKNNGLAQYAKSCGIALALAHSRGDRRSTLFEQAMSIMPVVATQTLIENCQQYAQQVTKDCEMLKELISAG